GAGRLFPPARTKRAAVRPPFLFQPPLRPAPIFLTKCFCQNRVGWGRYRGSAQMNNRIRGTAFHEAGNAIVARYLGLRVTELEIREDGSGKTDIIGSTDDLPLVDQIAIHSAGQASRTIFKCRSYAVAHSAEIGRLLEGLAADHGLEIRNAG